MHLDFSHYKEVKERRVSNAIDLPAQLGTRPTYHSVYLVIAGTSRRSPRCPSLHA